jgi:hypothetical protein
MFRVSEEDDWVLICSMWCNYQINDEFRNSETYATFLLKYGIKPIYDNCILKFYEFESEKHYLNFKLKYG